MKKTIKEERDRVIIKEEIIDNNSLIQYEYDEETNNILLVVRFIKHDTINENVLITMTLDEYNDELAKIVKFNKNNSAIALFQKINYGNFNEYTLKDCYDLKEHSFASTEFLDIEYNEKFPNNKVDKYLVVKKKK